MMCTTLRIALGVLALLVGPTTLLAQQAVASPSQDSHERCEIRVSDEIYRPQLEEWCSTGIISQISVAVGNQSAIFQVALTREAQSQWPEVREKVASSLREAVVGAATSSGANVTLIVRDFDAKTLVTCRA